MALEGLSITVPGGKRPKRSGDGVADGFLPAQIDE